MREQATRRRRWLERGSWLMLGLMSGAATTAAAGVETLYQKLEVLAEVFGQIENHFVDVVEPSSLIYGAARGAVSTLDAHSAFFSPEEYRDLLSATEGEYAGIGIELSGRAETTQVTWVFDDSPAAQAGIKKGDLLVAIDGEAIDDLPLDLIHQRLRGPVGSKVVLKLRHPERADVWSYTLVRSWIRVVPLAATTLEPGLEYVRLKSFARRVALDLEAQLKALPPKTGLVLDLRGNPGGLFDEAVAVCDLFLTDGPIVQAAGKGGRLLERRFAHERGTQPSYPLAILIDADSASAAEVVAGALHDRGRARLFGSRSYGKGSVQNIVALSDGSGLKLTVARYLTPSGVAIDGKGIEPDVSVANAPPDGDTDPVVAAAVEWLRRSTAPPR
ncbi:MAG: S41 family peptidase [Deltaproteobacteria bacterium]|nr:S41 family peptidase [Deltaproteobacteria bacterium]